MLMKSQFRSYIYCLFSVSFFFFFFIFFGKVDALFIHNQIGIWGIETSFRDLKHTIGATNFHSKKTEFVTLELWSRLILYNFCSIIILHVPIKHKNRKHEYQVNFSLAMKICFDFLRGIAPPDIESLISKYILPIRLERNYARQHRVQKPISFSYRFV